jgi:hypothetical protein
VRRGRAATSNAPRTDCAGRHAGGWQWPGAHGPQRDGAGENKRAQKSVKLCRCLTLLPT